MASTAVPRTVHVSLKRAYHIYSPKYRSSTLSVLWSVAAPLGRPKQQPSKQHLQALSFHTTAVVLARKKEKSPKSSFNVIGNLDKESESAVPKPHISMTESDKPDMMDLVDLIMAGTSYQDAVKGTEFDTLDEETTQKFEESIRRFTAQREYRLEEYLQSKGEVELLNNVRNIKSKSNTNVKESEEEVVPPPPPAMARKSGEGVQMAQGKWAEILVHSDRVTKTVKGGMEVQYRALVTVGNLHGVGGFAIGKAANPAEAITEASRKAKLLPNLIYVERYKQACLCHDVVGKFNGSIVNIWSRPPGHGMRAGKLSRDILYNMGITDGACKIIGRRNKYSMIYALFDALAKHRGVETIARGRGKRILSLQREMAGRFA